MHMVAVSCPAVRFASSHADPDLICAGEELLRQSGVGYTVVRPGQLTNNEGGKEELKLGQSYSVPGKTNLSVLEDTKMRDDAFRYEPSLFCLRMHSPGRQGVSGQGFACRCRGSLHCRSRSSRGIELEDH